MHAPVARLPSPQELEGAVRLALARARKNFADYRLLMRSTMLWNWWTEGVACELQQFYDDLVAGHRPILALMAPPQHGKSIAVTDFMTWVAGKNPDLKTIFGSYSDELGTKTNLALQRTLIHPRYAAVFPRTRIGIPGWECNTSHIEFAFHRGSFRNTTVKGGVNGMELNFGVIDDPVKGRREASSKQERDATWGWFTDDFLSRFAADAGLIIIMTRWHVDDLLGRAIDRFKGRVRVLKYEAIATEDEDFRKKGEPLFPALKPLDFLLERRAVLTDASWESLYQQSPYAVGGGQLPVDKMRPVPFLDKTKLVRSVRYWDKAGTDERDNDKAARTSGCLMHQMSDKTFVIGDITKGRWGALDREEKIEATSRADAAIYSSYEVYVEQEPGSGGKESAEATVRRLSGLSVYMDKVTGDKETRAEPFAAQVQGGNIGYVAGEWYYDWAEECESWPSGRFKDQVDSAAGAFNKLTGDGGIETWVKLGMM